MLVVLQTAVTMARLPVVNEHFRVLRFVAHGASEPAVIFVSVREYDSPYVGKEKTGGTQPRTQRLDRFFRFGTGVDDRHRVLSDQIDIYRTDVERRWQ